MKQGMASRSGPGARKVESVAHVVSPAAVSQLGEAMGNHVTDQGKILRGAGAPLYEGRNDNLAPKAGITIHHGGSQGKHK